MSETNPNLTQQQAKELDALGDEVPAWLRVTPEERQALSQQGFMDLMKERGVDLSDVPAWLLEPVEKTGPADQDFSTRPDLPRIDGADVDPEITQPTEVDKNAIVREFVGEVKEFLQNPKLNADDRAQIRGLIADAAAHRSDAISRLIVGITNKNK